MRIAYLDCFSGISGDMFLGALVSAGVSTDLLRKTVAALDLDAELQISEVMRSGINATKVDVIVAGEKDLPREVYQAQRAATFQDEHTFVHAHARHPDPIHTEEHQENLPPRTHGEPGHTPAPHGRSLRDIRAIIERAALTSRTKATAIAMFQVLGTAEAAIHSVPLEDIHFHEVGSADALVDITCAAAGAEALSVGEWICSPLNVGGGTVECAHGRFPVPAPATLEILREKNAPVYSSGIDKELVTPTGAAIISVLAKSFGPFPEMKAASIGYGAGYRDLPGHPNVLRLSLGEAATASNSESVTVLETNLDDTSPQVIGYFIERALSEGALDVFTTAVQMKKNRPGLLLTLLCKPADADRLSRLMFTETTTLGIRMKQETRQCLDRSYCTVKTPWGGVRIKLGSHGSQVTNCAPEYEDCRRIATEHQIALKTVMQEAMRCYRNCKERDNWDSGIGI